MNVNPNVTRAMAALAMAEGLASNGRSFQPLTITLGEAAGLRISSSSAASSIRAVLAGGVDVAIANPSCALLQAFVGTGSFDAPQPVRLIAVLPSRDELVFAAHPSSSLSCFEDVAKAVRPLRISLRGSRDHSIHDVLGAVTAAAGFRLKDIEARGGQLIYEGGVPRPDSERFKACAEGRIDAVFDEGVDEWLQAAIDAGMRILPLREETVRALESIGYRRAWLRKTSFPGLAADVLTVDFSGWPIFTRADLPDAHVRALCEALATQGGRVPWEGSGVLPIEEMCHDTPAGPHMAPLHRAAEAFWRDRGFI